MLTTAIFLGLALAFCFGTSDYLSRGLARDVGPYRTAIYTLAVSGFLVIVPMAFLDPFAGPISTGLLLLISVSTFVAFLLMYRGYQRGDVSIISPVVNSFPAFAVILAIFVLHVRLPDAVLLALAGVILGIILVSTRVSTLGELTRGRLTPGVPDAVLAAFFFAVSWTALGYADETIGYLIPVVFARLGAAALGLLLALPPVQENVKPFGGRALRRLLVMSVLEVGGILAFSAGLIYGSSIGSIPIITTLGGMGVVFTVGYALVFLREKVEVNYALGIAILVASVVALLYLTA